MSIPPRGKCPLCLQSGPLVRSHIIPEAIYRSAYDPSHRLAQVELHSDRARVLQGGERIPLLCRRCDQMFGNYEKQFKEAWFDRKALPDKIRGNLVKVTAVRPDVYRYLHLSILWRFSFLDRSPVTLGRYGESIRIALLSGDLSKVKAIPILGVALYTANKAPAYGCISDPIACVYKDARVYVICYAGCEWYFIVTDRDLARFKDVEGFLPRDGEAIFLGTRLVSEGLWIDWFMKRRGKPLPKSPLL